MVIYNVIFLINTTITKKDYLSIFGFSFIIQDDSYMEDEIAKNSLVVTYKEKEYKLDINQNISYVVNGKIRTNKIISKHVEENKIKYTTKSNKTYYPDIEEVTYNMIIGKEICSIWGLGFILKIIQTKIFTLISILFLILKFLYNKDLYKKTRKRRNKKKRLESEK